MSRPKHTKGFLNEVTVTFVLTAVLDLDPAKQEPRHQSRAVKVLTALGWRLRGVGKVAETDPEKIAEGKTRKSIKVYARKEPIENALPFKPGMSRSDLHALRAKRDGKDKNNEYPQVNELLDNV